MTRYFNSHLFFFGNQVYWRDNCQTILEWPGGKASEKKDLTKNTNTLAMNTGLIFFHYHSCSHMSDKTVFRIVINEAKILLKFVFNRNMLSAYKHSMYLYYILRIQEEMKIVKK